MIYDLYFHDDFDGRAAGEPRRTASAECAPARGTCAGGAPASGHGATGSGAGIRRRRAAGRRSAPKRTDNLGPHTAGLG